MKAAEHKNDICFGHAPSSTTISERLKAFAQDLFSLGSPFRVCGDMRLCPAGAAAGAYSPLAGSFPLTNLRERYAAFAVGTNLTEPTARPAGFRAPSSAGGERLRTQQTGQPTCVMICGNVKLLDAESLKKASDYYRVIVIGELSFDPPRSRKLHVYGDGIVSESFERLIHSHSPDAIWYISGYADGQDGLDDETHVVDTLMKVCDANDIPKLIVVSSLSSFDYVMGRDQDGREEKRFTTARAFGCNQVEQRIRFLSALYGQKVILLRAPFLANNNNKSNRLGTMLSEVIHGGVARLPYEQDQAIDFLSVNNLTELLISITEESTDKPGEYAVFSGFTHSSSELGEALMGLSEEAKVAYGDEQSERIRFNAHFDSESIRKNYGFVPTDDVFEELEEDYRRLMASQKKKSRFAEVMKAFFRRLPSNLGKIIECLILFALVQVLLKYTSNNVFFRYVDLRLFFVLIIGSTHGMLWGVIAGILAGVSLYFSYAQINVTGIMLFYNMDYWLPFMVYLITGAVTGYIKSSKEEKLRFAEEERRMLEDKYVFLNGVYRSAIDNKGEYKRQILNYQDSFGKIFEAVSRLDSVMLDDIFMQGVETMERILDNRSFAIFTVDDYQKYGRLAACSREYSTRLRKSISIESIAPVYNTIVKGDTWKNTSFVPELPMYANAIVSDGKVRLIICLYEAANDQMSLYYVNLFTILCNLVRVSFLRALDYQDAINDRKYHPGTDVLRSEYFRQELEIQKRMSEAGVASHLLLKIYSEDVNSLAEKSRGLVRQSDFLGEDENGELYLLLSMVTKDTFSVIGERLKNKGIAFSIVEEG